MTALTIEKLRRARDILDAGTNAGPHRPPQFPAWDVMTPQEIFDDLDASDFVFVIPDEAADDIERQHGRLPRSCFRPLPLAAA